MTNKEILEGSKLIAEFMGGKFCEENYYIDYVLQKNSPRNMRGETLIHISRIAYDSSWDWLMPIIDKIDILSPYGRTFIEGLRMDSGKDSRIGLKSKIVNWGCDLGESYYRSKISKIDAAYNATIKWINWYNKNK